jgi:Uma2 family endonuclease
MSHVPARRLLTRHDFHRMGEAGILTEDDRVELLNGELIQMSPIGARHAAAVRRLDRLFTRRLSHAIVSAQNPISLDDYSEPQPDIAILRPRPDEYVVDHPTPRDILLLVEVMDTSQEYDRGRKLRRYAEDGIQEVWLVDLVAELIEMYRRPVGDTYRSVSRCRRGQRLQVAAFPRKWFRVNEILG